MWMPAEHGARERFHDLLLDMQSTRDCSVVVELIDRVGHCSKSTWQRKNTPNGRKKYLDGA
jgi:hypothetical protein